MTTRHVYGGKFLLRFEDTDPRLKKSSLAYYGYIREDLAWLGCSPDEEYIQSDRMETYYSYAKDLISRGRGLRLHLQRRVLPRTGGEG